ncbi:MAG: MATE family efflux transporter [Candidatus Omnitrophica bacterium]|nr:MATE family efflux transporter [Candidatus Omnitrophota bacterium]
MKNLVTISFLRRFWDLSWPTVLYSILESAVGIVDIFLASYLGAEAVAAIGFSRQIYLIMMIGTLSITTGTITLVSQSYGAKRYDTASSAASHSLFLSMLAGVVLGAVGVWLARPSLLLLGAESQALEGGTLYLRVLMGGVVFLMINFSTNAIFRALGDMVTPLKIASWVNVLNVIFSYVLIFGVGPCPAFGVMGVAMGTILARAVGSVIAIQMLRKPGRLVRVSMRARWDLSIYRGILSVGLPSGFAGFFRNGARILFFRILAVTAAGTTAVAAATIGFQIRTFVIMPALAFQVATATLVGQSIGGQKIDQAEAYGWTAIQFCSVLMALASLLIFLLPEQIMRVFSDSAGVIEAGCWALRFIALEQLCNSISIIISGALTGAGDTRPALRYTIWSQWMLMLPLAYLLVYCTSWDVSGAWLAWGFAPILQLLLTFRRFLQGNWKEIRVPGVISDISDQ